MNKYYTIINEQTGKFLVTNAQKQFIWGDECMLKFRTKNAAEMLLKNKSFRSHCKIVESK